MSLKSFHILFIILAILLSMGCAWWSFSNGVALGFGVGSCAVAFGLVIYGYFFLKKARKLIL
jgi:hypothetical protein